MDARICSHVGYTSTEAKQALARVRAKRGKKRRAERRTYKCRHCGMWHLTSKSR